MQYQMKIGCVLVGCVTIFLLSYLYLPTSRVLAVEVTTHNVGIKKSMIQPSTHLDRPGLGLGKKAIIEVRSIDAAFRLSAAAKQALLIRSHAMEVSKQRAWVPLSSLVEYQQHLGIFVVQNQWYRLIPVRQINRTRKGAWVSSNELSTDQDLVIVGISMLRIAYLDALSQTGRGETEE